MKTRSSVIVAGMLFACAVVSAYAQPSSRRYGEECWNPRAGHFERVRPGERQDDLDFSRCRNR